MPIDPQTGKHIPKNPVKFSFDEEVTQVFDNMAVRSLPLYVYVNSAITDICSRVQPVATESVWDMGASTGAGLIAAKRGVSDPLVDFYGVDISRPMLDKMVDKFPLAQPVHHDFTETNSLPAQCKQSKPKVIIWNWTLQFMADIDLRRKLLLQSFDVLQPGGALVLSEKFSDSAEGRTHSADLHTKMMQDAYLWWRRDNGYSTHEIIAKSKALSGAMYPWARSDAVEALSSAGFKRSSIFVLYHMFNFGGFVAYK